MLIADKRHSLRIYRINKYEYFKEILKNAIYSTLLY